MRSRILPAGLAAAGLFFCLLPGFPVSGLSAQEGGGPSIYHDGWIDLNKNGKKDAYEDPSLPVEKRIDDLLSRMTLEEKTCQMCTLYGYQRVLKDPLPTPGWKKRIWKDGIGAIDEHLNGFRGWRRPPQDISWVKKPSLHARALNLVQSFFVEETRLGIPVDFTNEGIRGVEAYQATDFPTPLAMGQTWDKELVLEMGRITGKEAALLGYTNVYAPILDVGRDQRWGRYEEVFGESPFLVAELGIALARGIQEKGRVAATAKHFCIYSNNKGAREGYARVDPRVPPREVETIHLYPWKRVIREAGLLGVMASYNGYDGVPIEGSPYWLTERLRKDFGFKGYVVSDSGAVAYLAGKHHVAADYEEAVLQSVLAGLNVRCNFSSPKRFIRPLRNLVRKGRLSMAVLEKRVRDILRVKFTLGLFDRPYVENPAEADRVVFSESHRAFSLRASRECLVLLENKGGILPLEEKKLRRIAVVGPNAKDTRYALTHYGPVAVPTISVLEGIRKRSAGKFEVLYEKGCDLTDSHWPESEILPYPLSEKEKARIEKAVDAARRSDLVIAVVGGNVDTCGENKSRTSLDLPGRQRSLLQALKAVGKPLVVVVISGRPLSVNWCRKNADALLQAFYPGPYGGRAVAEVLFGDTNPSGKLSVTIPKTAGQIPMNFPCKPASQVAAGPAGVNGLLYPFGYGLSYTTFRYSNLEISPKEIPPTGTVRVSFDVANTGDRPGEEIAQLYVRDLVSSVTTYEKNLRGFQRVSLAPGEKKRLTFRLLPRDLQLLNRERKWVVEPGAIQVLVGPSSTRLPLKARFTVTLPKGKNPTK